MTRKVYRDGAYYWEDDEAPLTTINNGTDLQIIEGVLTETDDMGRVMPMGRRAE